MSQLLVVAGLKRGVGLSLKHMLAVVVQRVATVIRVYRDCIITLGVLIVIVIATFICVHQALPIRGLWLRKPLQELQGNSTEYAVGV